MIRPDIPSTTPNSAQTTQLQGQPSVQEAAPSQVKPKDRDVSSLSVKIAPNLNTTDPVKAIKLRESMALTGGSMRISAGNVEKKVTGEGKMLLGGKIKKGVETEGQKASASVSGKTSTEEKGIDQDVQKAHSNLANISSKISTLEEKAEGLLKRLDEKDPKKQPSFKEIETLSREVKVIRSEIEKLQNEMADSVGNVSISANEIRNPHIMKALIQKDPNLALSLMEQHKMEDGDVKNLANDLCKTSAGKKLGSHLAQAAVRKDVENARTYQEVFRQTQTPSQVFISAFQSNLMSKPLEKPLSEISGRLKTPTDRNTPEGLAKVRENVSKGLNVLSANLAGNTPPEMRAVYKAFAEAYVQKFPDQAGEVKTHVTSFLVLKTVNPKLTTPPELTPTERREAVAFSKVLQLAVNNNTDIKGEDWQKPLKGYPPDTQATEDNRAVDPQGQPVTNDPKNFIAASQPQIDELYKAMVG